MTSHYYDRHNVLGSVPCFNSDAAYHHIAKESAEEIRLNKIEADFEEQLNDSDELIEDILKLACIDIDTDYFRQLILSPGKVDAEKFKTFMADALEEGRQFILDKRLGL